MISLGGAADPESGSVARIPVWRSALGLLVGAAADSRFATDV